MILNTGMYTHYYIPPANEAELRAYVLSHPFAHLITATQQAGLHCTAVATVQEPSEDAACFTLLAHLAKRNPHAAALDHADSALLLFPGAHAYISPRWYASRAEVPTWNYIAVQARGTLELIDDVGGIESVLRRTIQSVEREQREPWTLDMAPREVVERLLPNVRAFRIRVQRLEGTFKVSQNKSAADRKGVIDALRAKGDGDSVAMAALIAEAPR
ncbi:MAG: FMN-binding negative transcriptional regulator [Steroidobacteraceae bacterium]